jgi:hypothetical protein
MESGGSPDSPENLGYIAMVRILEQNLKATIVDPPAVLTIIQPEGKHMPATWATRFARAIEFLYPPPLPQKARQQPASGPLPMRR